jgi:murein DD-endopeptidase MepM/ murein hydrolase activator NlpD
MIEQQLTSDKHPKWNLFFNLLLSTIALIGLGLILVACSSRPGANELPATSSPRPTVVPTFTATLLPKSATPRPTSTSSPVPPSPSPTPCAGEVCIYPGHFVLSRPIGPEDIDIIDPTYRYGSTQGGLRKTHHGVEFVNPQGTPVLAAADGIVIVAGNDHQTPYAAYPLFYGNLVIIKHNLPRFDKTIFTVYGHLSKILAEVGQRVSAGEQIGLVGFTGAAIGEHLHFEVRLGKNHYNHTRNPELWLLPHSDEDGHLHGAIAGQVLDEYGDPIYIPTVTIKPLNLQAGDPTETFYLETYADWTVNGDDSWEENFAIGDLPAGSYQITFVARGLQSYKVEVEPGKVTTIRFDAREREE